MTVRTTADRAVPDPVLPDHILYDAIDRAVREMAAHLDHALIGAGAGPVDAGDREAMRALLEDRLEPRFFRLSRDRAA